jgi:hypothetical protein
MTAFEQGRLYSSQLAAVKEAVHDHIYEIAPWDTPLIVRVGMNSLPGPNTQPVYKYQDMEHRPTVTTLNGAIAATTTTSFTFTDDIYKDGDEIQIETEIIKLGGNTGGNLTFATCTRGMGGTTAATYSSGQQVSSLDKLQVQGTPSGSSDAHIMPSQITNNNTIIKREIAVSRTADVTSRYGASGSEYDTQKVYQTGIAFQVLENRVLWGYSQTAATSATAGGMNGVWQRINSTSSTNMGAANMSTSDFRTGIRPINKYGAAKEELLALVPLWQKDVIDSWGQPYINHAVQPTAEVKQLLGTEVSYLFLGGRRILLVPYPKLETELFVITPSMVNVGPLTDSAFHHVFMGIDGDRVAGHVVGEYSCAVPAVHTHYVYYNLAYS